MLEWLKEIYTLPEGVALWAQMLYCFVITGGLMYIVLTLLEIVKIVYLKMNSNDPNGFEPAIFKIMVGFIPKSFYIAGLVVFAILILWNVYA